MIGITKQMTVRAAKRSSPQRTARRLLAAAGRRGRPRRQSRLPARAYSTRGRRGGENEATDELDLLPMRQMIRQVLQWMLERRKGKIVLTGGPNAITGT